MAKKRQVSAKTKVKLSQAAKKRRRGPKGSMYAGRFMDSLSMAGARHHYAAGPNEKGGNRPKGMSAGQINPESGRQGRNLMGSERQKRGAGGQTAEEIAWSVFQKEFSARAPKQGEESARRDAMQIAGLMAENRTGARPNWDRLPIDARIRRSGIMSPTGGGEHANEYKQAEQLLAKAKGPEDVVKKQTPKKMFDNLAADEQAQLMDPHSDLRRSLAQGMAIDHVIQSKSEKTGEYTRYYRTYGERDRVQKYLQARASGASQQDAIASSLSDKRGQRSSGKTKPTTSVRDDPNYVAGGGRSTVTRSELKTAVTKGRTRSGSRVKGGNLAPRAGERTFGYDIPGVRTTAQLAEAYPGLTERDYIKVQQAERETIFDEFMKNRAWAHETRNAKMPNAQEKADRITFFTTSVGYPNVSVPADSLIGQYIVRKRRRMVSDAGIAKGAALAGSFPEAVRDMHIVEFGTGAKLGAEGSAGVLHRTGWRAGARKQSQNYGRLVPVGSTILRDTSGQPIYDSSGNIVYSEGATRPFKIGTNKEVGLRVFIG